MKKSLLFLLLCGWGMALPGTLRAQENQRITLEMKQATIEEVIMRIEATTDYGIAFRKNILPPLRRNYHFRNSSIVEVLNKLVEDTKLAWARSGNIITLSVSTVGNKPKVLRVKGIVRDNQGVPIPGAGIRIKGDIGVMMTDKDGGFSMAAPIPGTVIQISYIGKRPVEVQYTNQKEITVTMEDNITVMNDVVVTGIFTRKKETYTGAVTTITANELKMFRAQNLLQTLRNIDPSINIIDDNISGANPNAMPQINIRGNSTLPMSIEDYNATSSNLINTPLIVMDGFEISLSRLMDFNDNEIESINILKDAAATAIYGSRGANGVIVIISKAPAAGKLKISLNAGWDLEMPDLTSYDLLNARELLDLQAKVGTYNPGNLAGHTRAMQSYRERIKNVEEGVNTDWLHYPVQTGVSQRHNLRLEGGSNEFRWATTLGLNRTAGAMKGTNRNMLNGGITLSYTYNKIVFRNQLSIGINKAVESPYGAFSDYVKMRPYDKPFDQNGDPIPTYDRAYVDQGALIGNPLYNAMLNKRNDSRYTDIMNNFSVDWTISPGLYLRSRFGISGKENKNDVFLPPSHTEFQSAEYQSEEGSFRKGRYTFTRGDDLNWDASATLNYAKAFNQLHRIYAGIDFNMREQSGTSYQVVAEGFTNDHQDFYGNAMQYLQNGVPSGTESTTRSLGFTGTTNYSYDNRYYADLSFRMDGSSQFGSKNRFAPFWSAGLGWNLHNENFMKDSKVLNSMRLRTTYGVTGSQNFQAYQAQAIYRYFSNDRYLKRAGIYMLALSNDELRWQTTNQLNMGFDADLLNRRIQMSFDYYIKTTEGLLSAMPLPLSTGYSSFIDNVGKVRNNGFESSLSTYIINNTGTSSWSWMVSGKLAYNKNKIIKLSEAVKSQTEQYRQQDVEVANLFYEGYSQNSIWTVRSLGIDPSTGQELFFDANGNISTVWHPGAKVYSGVGEPQFRGNFTSMLRYKNFMLNLNFGYHWGGQTINNTLRDKVEVSNSIIGEQNVDRRVLSARWSQIGDVTFFKGHSNDMTRATSRFVMNDRVIQLQSASLQYRFSDVKFLRKINTQSLSIAMNASDLFYISTVRRERGTEYPFARRAGISVALQF